MKFDVIVINPPYKSGLHIEIFNKAFEELNDGGTLICLHRETPAITKASNPKYKKETDEYRNIMLNNTSEITFIDGNYIFKNSNTNFFAPLIISKVKKDRNKSEITVNSNHLKNKFSYNVSSFDDIFIHTDIQKTLQIRDKVKKISIQNGLTNLNKKSSKYCTSKYYVNIKQLGGNKPKDGKINKDFYCLISPKYENDLKNQITNNLSSISKNGRGGGITAETYEEAINLFSYLKTKFVRFVFSLTKIDQNIWDGDMISVIPYLDFTKKWSDVDLFKYFELEDDLIEYINEYIESVYDYEKSN